MAVGGQAPLALGRAGVVDQDVEDGMGGERARRGLPRRRERREVEEEQLGRSAAGGDRIDHRLAARRVACADQDARGRLSV